MYCVRKTPTRTDSDSTNICETSFWEIQCELKVAKKEKKACLLLIITILSHSEASGLTKIRQAGGGVREKKKKLSITLTREQTPRAATRRENKTKTNYSTRHAGIHLAQRLRIQKQKQTITLATAAIEKRKKQKRTIGGAPGDGRA